MGEAHVLQWTKLRADESQKLYGRHKGLTLSNTGKAMAKIRLWGQDKSYLKTIIRGNNKR